MKIILIGKTGQLGSELNKILVDKSFETFSFSHRELNITNHDKVLQYLKKIKPDYVINASAYHQVSKCENFPEKAFDINAAGVKHLAEECYRIGAGLVHYSSDYVFDGKKGKPYLEEDRTSPLQVYGISKYAGEILAQEYNPKALVIRTCGVYGGKHGSRSKKGNFILTILNQIKGRRELPVSSEQIVSPTYAFDLANATIDLLSKKPGGGIYHLVNEGYCSWADFAKEIVRNSGSSTKIIPVNRKGDSGGARRPLFSALFNSKAKKMGVKLPDWQDALKRYIEFLYQ